MFPEGFLELDTKEPTKARSASKIADYPLNQGKSTSGWPTLDVLKRLQAQRQNPSPHEFVFRGKRSGKLNGEYVEKIQKICSVGKAFGRRELPQLAAYVCFMACDERRAPSHCSRNSGPQLYHSRTTLHTLSTRRNARDNGKQRLLISNMGNLVPHILPTTLRKDALSCIKASHNYPLAVILKSPINADSGYL